MVTCPVCRGDNVTLQNFGDESITTCGDCGGHLVSEVQFRRLIEKRHDERVGRRKDSLQDSAPCLVCGETMDLAPYGGDSDIIVRKCDHCESVWLARGQAAQIYDYLHSLDRYDRKVADLRVDLAQKASEVEKSLDAEYKKYRK